MFKLCTLVRMWSYVHVWLERPIVSCSRAEVVATDEVGVYHVWTRCVRRAFLCGVDAHSGKDYEYRRQWIQEFLQQLAGLCGVEVGFHAEMANRALSAAHEFLIISASVGGKLRRMMGRSTSPVIQSSQGCCRRMIRLVRSS